MTEIKDVRIKITGFLVSLEGEEQDMEIYTYADMEVDGDSITLRYEEPLVSHRKNVECEISLKPDSMEIKRQDPGNHHYDGSMYFEEGFKTTSDYATPAGPVEMEMVTTAFDNKVSPEGEGYVEVRYQLCLRGLVDGERRVRLDFLEKKNHEFYRNSKV